MATLSQSDRTRVDECTPRDRRSHARMVVHPNASVIATASWATILVLSGGTLTCLRPGAIGSYSIVYVQTGGLVNVSCFSQRTAVYYDTTASLFGAGQLAPCDYTTRGSSVEGCLCPAAGQVTTLNAPSPLCAFDCYNGGSPIVLSNGTCSECTGCDTAGYNTSNHCQTCNAGIVCDRGAVNATNGCQCICDSGWTGTTCSRSLCNVTVASYTNVWAQGYRTTRSYRDLLVQSNASVVATSSRADIMVLPGGSVDCTGGSPGPCPCPRARAGGTRRGSPQPPIPVQSETCGVGFRVQATRLFSISLDAPRAMWSQRPRPMPCALAVLRS